LLLTNAGMAYVYTRYLRSTYYWIPVFALSAVFLLARKQGPFWPRRPRWAPTALAAGIACCALLLASRAGYQSICRPTASRWCGFGISYQNPVEEAEFIRTHLAQYRLGNDYGGGGYLLWRLHPQTKVMIDPRSFPIAPGWPAISVCERTGDPPVRRRFPGRCLVPEPRL